MGFLQICAGVVLLQLSKSAKDVPDTAVLNGDLDQIRTVGEQEQPESEPQADAIRGAAALLRSTSVVRQKREQDEARRVYEDKLRDKMEPIGEGEVVEWDGLRRRKTIIGPSASLARRKTLHPPLGLTRIVTDEDEPLQAVPRRDTLDSRFSFAMSPRRDTMSPRRDTLSSRIVFEAPFSPHPKMPVEVSNNGQAVAGENLEMQHVYGLPPGLASDSADQSPGTQSQHNKPIAWASDVEAKPKLGRPGGLDGADTRSPARRQFSFQNIFHKNKDDTRREDTIHLKVNTEEERMGLTRGDSNNPSSDEDENLPVYEMGSHSLTDVSSRSGRGNLAVPDLPRHSLSSPDIRTPGNGRPLPQLPPEDATDDEEHDFEKDFKDIEGYDSQYDGRGKDPRSGFR